VKYTKNACTELPPPIWLRAVVTACPAVVLGVTPDAARNTQLESSPGDVGILGPVDRAGTALGPELAHPTKPADTRTRAATT
jgi:hypothetical protein